jgi:hypothetical protein
MGGQGSRGVDFQLPWIHVQLDIAQGGVNARSKFQSVLTGIDTVLVLDSHGDHF